MNRMSLRFAVVGLIILAVACVNANVIDLEDSNFFDKINEFQGTGKPILVKFFAPWCGHCKKLAPIYDEVGDNLAGKAYIAKVDCTKNQQTCQTFGIRGYPTVKLIKSNKVYDFRQSRDLNTISNFVLSDSHSDGADIPKAGSVPPPPPAPAAGNTASTPDKVLNAYLEPVLKIVQNNAGISLAIFLTFVFIIGFLIGRVTAPDPIDVAKLIAAAEKKKD